jgi:hypothetical protein
MVTTRTHITITTGTITPPVATDIRIQPGNNTSIRVRRDPTRHCRCMILIAVPASFWVWLN